MPKTLRSRLLLAAALTFLPLVAHAAACPTAPTYGGLTGKDATPATQTLQTVTGSGGLQATPMAHGWDGTNSKPITLDGNCEQLVVAAGRTIIVGATFTTTATTTALTDGQLLANSATAGSVTPLDFSVACRINQGSGMIRRARFKIPDTGLAGKSVYLELYRDSPTVTNGDHGAWLSTESNWIGRIPITLDQHFSDPLEKGVGAPDQGAEINFDCASASTHLYGLLVANGPSGTLQGSKTATVVLEVLAN